MAKQGGKNRVTIEEYKERSNLVDAALDAGALSYVEICRVAGISEGKLQHTFRNNEELHKKYITNLMRLKTIATQNWVNAIVDKDHPKNYDATMKFITKYKSDLDDIFEKNTDDEDFILTGGRPKTIEITFTPQTE